MSGSEAGCDQRNEEEAGAGPLPNLELIELGSDCRSLQAFNTRFKGAGSEAQGQEGGLPPLLWIGLVGADNAGAFRN